MDFNATQAAIRTGYSKNTAAVIGSENLRKPNIQAFIAKLKQPIEEKLELSAERVLHEIKCLAYAKPSDYYKQENGKMVLKGLFELTDAQQRAIRHVEVRNGKVVSYELYNKDPSLDKLGKNLKLFTELNETVHSFTMMGNVTSKEKKKGAGAKVTVREFQFEVGEEPRAR